MRDAPRRAALLSCGRLLLLAACLAGPARAAALELDTLLRLLAAVPATKNSFTETKHSALLSAPLVMKGTLAYQRPDRLEKYVLSPYDERTLITGGVVTVENRSLQQTRSFSLATSATVSALVESMRATLAGDRESLERHYKMKLEGQLDAWVLELAPRDRKLAGLVRQIQIAGARERLRRIEVEEASGDRSVMLIGPAPP